MNGGGETLALQKIIAIAAGPEANQRPDAADHRVAEKQQAEHAPARDEVLGATRRGKRNP